jgi:ribonuclease PH
VGKYLEAPTVIAEEGGMLARVGDTVVLKCSALGYPTPVIMWMKNEEKIVTNSKYEVSIISTSRNSLMPVSCSLVPEQIFMFRSERCFIV